MSDGFQRVQAGQKLAISARAYNAMLEAAESHQRNKQSGGAGAAPGGYSAIVIVKNASGSDAARFDVLGISGVVFSPADADALQQFKNCIVLSGSLPSTASHDGGRFVVCAEPIPNGAFGRAYAHGVCQVQINVTDAAHLFAEVKDGDHALLNSAESGAVSILWKESGTGTKWAIVRFGASGGGGNGGSDQLTMYEVAQTPTMGALAAAYKLRPLATAAWANNVAYAVNDIVKKTISGTDKAYKCKLSHTSGGDGVWVANTPYALGARVYVGSRNNTTYKCTTPTSGDATFPAGKFTADNDEPENGAWATYWDVLTLDGYIFAPPFTGNYIQEYAPLLNVGEPVLTIVDINNKIWIVSPAFMRIAVASGGVIVQKSLWWNTSERRLMSTFGG
jgi:hypothetical protein